jgi:HEAT repeat protein
VGIFQVIAKIFDSAWGGWSIAAFALGIFFWITASVIKKAKPGKFDGEQTYRFFRLAMVLAFLLAVATLVTAAAKEILITPGKSKEERIQQLTLDLKSPDPTRRRQAVEVLVPYGSAAARELVKAISEEAGVIASEMFGRATGGDLGDLFSSMLGVQPWETRFMEAATACLVRIGEPSVAPVLNQLAAESVEAERLLDEAAPRQSPQNPDLAVALGQWGFLLRAAGQGMRVGITRDVLAKSLLGIGQPAVPELLNSLESPRLLVRMTSYEVLSQIPDATGPTIERLRQMAARSNSRVERDQLLAAIQQLGTRDRSSRP